MSIPHPKLIDLDYPAERLGAASPIINMPGPISGPEGAGTIDLRHLIDELQQAAVEAKARQRLAEEERDGLALRLEEAQRALHETRGRLAGGAITPDATQLFNLRQARDAAQALNRELTDKLARVEDELGELRDNLENGAPALPSLPADVPWEQRAEVTLQLEVVSKEVLGLRQQLQAREAELAAARGETAALAREAAATTASIAPMRAELEALAKTHEEAQTSLAAAQKQIERIMRERDEIRDNTREQVLTLEMELEGRRGREAKLESTAQASAQAGAQQAREALERSEAERAQLSARFEAQRVQTIDLAARLDAAQQEIRIVGARLAEARLQAKASGVRLEESIEPRRPSGDPLAVVPAEPGVFDNVAALDLIRAMRRCYHAFARTPDDFSHLNELHCQTHALAEQARESGFAALDRLAAGFDAFVQELYHFPEQITPASLATVPQTIEFLAGLMKMKDLRKLRDPANSTVYVVEDDPLTCECITMAMESAMLRGICSLDPAKAVCELAGTACDVIFLDIKMPGMDGFELCTEIRNMALHRDTPVIFISGLAGPEMREQAALAGGNDFLAKPFILCELTLKALTYIVKRQLHMA